MTNLIYINLRLTPDRRFFLSGAVDPLRGFFTPLPAPFYSASGAA